MQYADLNDRSIEELVNEVQALASVASKSQVQSVAALAARLTIELAAGLNGLSGNVFIAKKQLVERIDALNEVLREASGEASNHTRALVFWTKVLVAVTGLYTLITGGLLLVAVYSLRG